jgi:hypothetical protein
MVQYCQTNLGSIDVAGPISGEEAEESSEETLHESNEFSLPSDVPLQIPTEQIEEQVQSNSYESIANATPIPHENQENDADPNVDSLIASPELQSQSTKRKKSHKQSKKNKKQKSGKGVES